jgi:cardiolipin synthase A/B
MDELWKSIAELTSAMHHDRIICVADALSQMTDLSEFDRIRFSFGSGIDQPSIDRFLRTWKEALGITPAEVAHAFKTAAYAYSVKDTQGSLDLVWTGPKTGLIPIRQTEQVILEVISSATSDLFLVAYVFYRTPSIVEALNSAISRGIKVRILLEPSTEHGGTVRGDSIRAIRESVPGISVYAWHSPLRNSGPDTIQGSMHAKCAVADGKLAFITSANFTFSAMERNMELGMLIRGGIVPERLRQHLVALVVTNVITEVP